MDDPIIATLFEPPPQPVWRPTPGHAVFRVLFVPALLALSVVSWIFHPQVDAWLERANWGVGFMTVALLASMALIFIAEQLYPADPDWNYNVRKDPVRGLDRVGHDLFYLTVVTLLNGLVTGFLAVRTARWVGHLGHGLEVTRALWPSHLPFAVKVLLAFLIVELFSWGYHYAAHHVEVLWGFHSTHHVITEVTGLKAIRTHPVDNALFYLPRTVPLLVLGAGPGEILAATYFGCVLGVLSHANIDVAESGLGWFINLPQFHFVHHSSAFEESRSNYGCHTVIWDRLFGTFRKHKGDAPIGVEPVGVRTLWQELCWPLYRRVGMGASRRDPATGPD